MDASASITAAMAEHSHWHINEPRVVHQLMDSEVVVIHLDTGVYYSLTDSAACVWQALLAGASRATMLAALRREFAVNGAALEPALDSFLAALEAEQLISPGSRVAAAGLAPGTSGDGGAEQRPFVPPAFKRFSDMQELLLLDPVHEVDASGWPHLPPPSNGNP